MKRVNSDYERLVVFAEQHAKDNRYHIPSNHPGYWVKRGFAFLRWKKEYDIKALMGPYPDIVCIFTLNSQYTGGSHWYIARSKIFNFPIVVVDRNPINKHRKGFYLFPNEECKERVLAAMRGGN